MKPELYLSDALGAVGKPMFRVHTAGSVGGTTAIVAASHVQAGKHRTVLAVAFEKQSEGNAQFALGSGRGASLGAGGAFAPFIRAYIQRSGAPEHIGWKVAVKDRSERPQESLRPPQDRGHLHREGQSLADDVGADSVSRVVSLVRRRLCQWSSPMRPVAKPRPPTVGPPAWILGASSRSEPPSFPGRDPVRPAAAVQCAQQMSTPRPASRIHAGQSRYGRAVRARSRGTNRSGWNAFGLADEGERDGRLVDDGTTELGRFTPDQCVGRGVVQ
jgi:acetyl-CoA C-acetyltransferase